MRSTTRLWLASASLVLLGACNSVKVDNEWKELVPEEGLERFMPHAKSEFEPESVTMFYKKAKISQKDLHKAFEKKVESAGYKLLIECDEPHLVTGAKGTNSMVNIGVSELTADTLRVEMERADVNSLGFPEGKKCKWTDAAKDFCEVKGDECDFRAKIEKKK